MMAKTSTAISMLLIANFYYTSAQSVLNISPGIYSTEAISNGLSLPATTTFQPITNLTCKIHLDKSCSVFVHYQMNMQTANSYVYTKLMMNTYHAGSLVHSGLNTYKSATGFYMAKLGPGDYTFQVQYQSPVAINMAADWDWQTAILQVMWFEDADVRFDGIKCPATANAYDNWGSIKDVEVILDVPNDRAVISAYQLSVDMESPGLMVTSLKVDSFYYNTATFLKGDTNFLDLHGTWARNVYDGLHYFSITYRTPNALSFTDCKENFADNKNLYAMILPPSCHVAAVVRPQTTFNFGSTNEWAPSDVIYSLTLTKQTYVIVMYQHSGRISNGETHMVMRLNIDLVPQQHTVSLTGDTEYVGNFGLWQGALGSGPHEIILEYRTPGLSENTVSSNLEWEQFNKWMNRALTVITC